MDTFFPFSELRRLLRSAAGHPSDELTLLIERYRHDDSAARSSDGAPVLLQSAAYIITGALLRAPRAATPWPSVEIRDDPLPSTEWQPGRVDA